MSETELMPCPFCGDSAAVQGFHEEHYVVCTNCNAQTPEFVTSADDAIAAWNRRSPVAEGGEWRNALLEEAAMVAERAASTASSFSADKQRGMEIAAGRIAEAIRDLKQPLPSPPVPSQEGASDTGEQKASEHLSDPIREEMARALEAARSAMERLREANNPFSGINYAIGEVDAALSKHRAGSKASERTPNPR